MPKRDRDKQRDKKGKGKKGGQREPYFVQPLTGKRFKREMRSAERLEFQPERRQLQAESRASREQERRIQGYFDAYGQSVGQAGQASAAATATAQQAIGAQTAASSAQDAELRKTLEEAAKADAARRGVAYDPTGAATSMASSASRRGAADVFGGLTATQGASQAAYLADKRRIGEGERINQTLREQARGRSINADKRALAEAGGDFRTDYRSRARETERQFHLKNLALADAAAGRDTQLALARRYGKNKKREQQRSVANQLAVAGQQARNERANDRRSRQYARKFGGPSKDGGDGSAYSVRQAMGFLREAERDRNFKSRGQAVDYLLNRGVGQKVATQAVNRLLRGAQGSSDSATGQTVNATLNR